MDTFGRAKGIKFLIVSLVSSLIFLPGALTPAFASASLELSLNSGLVGTHVTIMGSGFDILSKVTVTFGNVVVSTDPNRITTDAMGRFEASFDVPQKAASGKNTVTATSRGIITTSSASATFLVLTNGDDPKKAVPTEPTAYYKSVSTDEDQEILITLRGDDQDGDGFRFGITAEPIHGVLSGPDLANGIVRYHPDRDYSGTDSFGFNVRNENGVSNPATVTIHVSPVNDAPTINSTQITVGEDDEVLIALTAADIDSSPVFFYLIDTPSHGQLGRLKLTGPFSAEITYEPRENYNGTDHFRIQVSDSKLFSDAAEVTMIVDSNNDAPIARHAEITIERVAPAQVSLAASDSDGDMLTYTIVSGPRHGTLSGIAPQLEYTPFPGYGGHDEFSFRVNDGIADSNIAIVGIWIAGTAAPKESPAEEGTPDVLVSPAATDKEATADSQPPKLVVPRSPVVAYANSEDTDATVTFSVSALDDVDGEVSAHCSPASGSIFPIGKVNVVCVARDDLGNTVIDSFVVEVKSMDTSDVGGGENQVMQGLVGGAIVSAILGIVIYEKFSHRRSRSGPAITVRPRTWSGFNRIFPHELHRITNLWDRSRGNH